MEKILSLLEIRNYVTIEFTGNLKGYLYNFENDKLIVAFNTKALEHVKIINSLIPKYKQQIQEAITNPINTMDVDKKIIPLSQFLWDIYIICFFNCTNETGENHDQVISDLERDRFVARKIIIKYKVLDDIKKQYEKIVFPNYYLDRLDFGTYDDDIQDDILSKVKEINSFLDK